MASPPPGTLSLDLEWDGDLRFRGRSGEVRILLDSAGRAGPSPVQGVAFSLAGCMAIDLVHILTRGRTPPGAVRAHLEAERSPIDPKRINAVRLHFVLEGEVSADRVERAIALSRETYCSVWHSLDRGIDLRTSFEILAPGR